MCIAINAHADISSQLTMFQPFYLYTEQRGKEFLRNGIGWFGEDTEDPEGPRAGHKIHYHRQAFGREKVPEGAAPRYQTLV